MRLRARETHEANLKALDLGVHFEAGEDLLTEISCKFTPEHLAGELERGGFRLTKSWTDDAPDFLVTLSRPQ